MEKFKPDNPDGMWKGAPKESFSKAQELRRRSTPAEIILWERLKNHQLDELKFRRQHPIGIYIADFYCHALKLVIEVDGDYHLSKEQQKKDQERTKYLILNGLRVIRFRNDEVEKTLDSVILKIKTTVAQIKNNK